MALKPDYSEGFHNYIRVKTFCIGDKEFSALEELANNVDRLPKAERVFVHFAFAKALEDVGDHARAFEHLLKGNALKRGQIAYDEAANLRYFEQIREVFDASLFERFQGAGDPSQTPIFVLGMPRSGSTMIEQILSCHPRVHGAGELNVLPKVCDDIFGSKKLKLLYPECVPTLDAASFGESNT